MGLKENGHHLEGKLRRTNSEHQKFRTKGEDHLAIGALQEIPALHLVKHDLFMSTSVMSMEASMEFEKSCWQI